MKHNLVFLESARLLYAYAEGRASIAGFRRLIVEILVDPRLLSGAKVLVDYRKLDFSGEKATAVRGLAELLKPHAERIERIRAASVVSSPLQFAMTRMWEALAEVSHVPLTHLVTQDFDAALIYLRLDQMPGLQAELDRLAEAAGLRGAAEAADASGASSSPQGH